MHVFVTGASGLIGSALVPQLVEAGHSVSCLARSETSAEKIKKLGASHIVLGTNEDLDKLANAAKESDAVVHLAFDHDLAFSNELDLACKKDQDVITAVGDNLKAGGFLFVATGTFGLDKPDEKATMQAESSPRYKSDQMVFAYAKKGIHAYMVRYPPVVHNFDRVHPFVGALVEKAKEQGFVSYVEGDSLGWPSVHVKDAGSLIVLALQGGAPSPTALHAVAEECIPTKAVAQIVGKKLGLEAKSVSPEQAISSLGFIGKILAESTKTTSQLTRQWLDWRPKEIGLIEEIQQNYHL